MGENDMSRETWNIVTSKEIEDVDLQLALQCAPLIAGLKISNLFIIPKEQYKAMGKILSGSNISWYVLLENDSKIILLLYHTGSLEDYLKKSEVRQMLLDEGYENTMVGNVLMEFSRRYRNYMKHKSGFPHEMGLLLGYPVEDVTGFIEYQGTQSLYTGYWKVYKDKDEKIRLFERFERAKEGIIQLLSRGLCMADIINICHPYRNLHMNSRVKVM
jgi:hypothetical protein